jgi:hypothetical protein
MAAMDESTIRAAIEELERCKNDIVARIGPAGQSLWIGDAKEMVSSVVAAFQMLRSDPHAARQFLNAARSRLERSCSEFRASDPVLEARTRAAFIKCEGLIAAEIGLPQQTPGRAVIRVSESHYEMPCSVCGAAAVKLFIGKDKILSPDRDALQYQGIIRRVALDLALAPQIFAALDDGRLRRVHELVPDEGVDGYCPECDRIYCGEHYRLEETFDEGFYDCTYGTCPEGHRRMLDD